MSSLQANTLTCLLSLFGQRGTGSSPLFALLHRSPNFFRAGSSTSVEQMAETEYDVLIVGSGAGGGAALWRLCEQWGNNGKKIGIVERGPLFLPTHVANIATINGDSFRLYAPPQITDLIGHRLPQFSGMKLVYAVGGRTLLWGAITPRVPDFELATWPVPIREMELYYNIAEEVMNVTTTYTKDSSITEVLLKRLRANGYLTMRMIFRLQPIWTRPVTADSILTSFSVPFY